MKNYRNAVAVIFATVLTMALNAQEFNINFEHNAKWKKVLKRAKKENKPIFVDCYTTWCGPCKILAREVFTQESVASFFNENFISVKMDMEKGEGIALKNEWEVKAFPTLLYFNSEGEIVHRIVGSYGADEFLTYSKMALDEDKMAANLQKRYDSGERGPDFMYNYLVSLRLGYMEDKEQEVAANYIKRLPKEDLLKEGNWNIIKNFLKNINSDAFEYIVLNHSKLSEQVGAENVDAYIYKNISKQLVKWKYDVKTFTEEKEQKLIGLLQAATYTKAPNLLSKVYAEKYIREGKNNQYIDLVDNIVKLNVVSVDSNPASEIVNYANTVSSSFTDDVSLAKALTWLQIAERRETRVEHKVAIFEAKSKVLKKLGDKSESELADLAAKKATKEAEAKGTVIRAIPAMKMTGGGMKPATKN